MTAGDLQMRPEVVAATQVVRSTDQVLDSFARATGPLFSRMSQNDRHSRALAALRDALLLKLISGQIRIKDAERIDPSAT